MPRPTPDPLTGATRLLIDGTNLLHAMARRGGPLPAVAVTGRLRALLPPGVSVTLVLDGGPAPGGTDRRLTSGIDVRYSGRRSADALLGDLASAAPDGTLVVTDDNALAASLRAAGARTARTSWLAERLSRQRLEAPAIGRPKPPGPPPPGTPGAADADDHAPTLEAGARRDQEDGQPQARPPALLRSRPATPGHPAERPYRAPPGVAR